MSVSEEQRTVVERMFKAMQMGPDGAGEMAAVFAEDATMVEPFSGEPQEHSGHGAIMEAFGAMGQDGPPDLDLQLTRLDMSGGKVRADWKCTSSVFPTAMAGYDLFDIEGGQIKRLEIVVTVMPDMGGH